MLQTNAYERKWRQYAERASDCVTRFQLPLLKGGRVDLFEAVFAKSLSGVRRALAGGFDPNEFHAGQTALMHAAELGLGDICRLLLRNGANVDTVDPFYSQTALHFAVRNLCADACLALIEGGARTDIQCSLGGETAADIAHIRGTIEIIRIVLYRRRPDNAGGLQLACDSDEEGSTAVGGDLAVEQAKPTQSLLSHRVTGSSMSVGQALAVDRRSGVLNCDPKTEAGALTVPEQVTGLMGHDLSTANDLSGKQEGIQGQTSWIQGGGKVPLEGSKFLCFPRRVHNMLVQIPAAANSPPRKTNPHNPL